MAFQNVGLRLTILGVSAFRRSIGDVERATSSLNRSLGASSGPLKSISTGLNNLGTTFMNVGRMMTMYVTVPLALLTAGLVTAGISFEDAFSGVSKTVDGVADDFGTLTDFGLQFRKDLVALSLVLPISANELARIAQAAGQVGVSKENLLEFTEIAAKMGVATNIASEDAAISLARFANILGISQQEFVGWAESAASAVVRLGNNVAATESEIMSMALRLAPAASVIGLTTAEILGIAAGLAEVGVRSERGGTAVSRIFLEMAEGAGSATAANEDFKASMAGMEPGLNQLRQLLNSGVTNFNDLQFALRDTGLDLSGLSSMLDDLGVPGGAVDSLNSQIARHNITMDGYRRTVQELERDLSALDTQYKAGDITLAQYESRIQSIRDQQEDVADSMERGAITAQDYNRRMQELSSNVVSVDDVIKHVAQNTIMEFESAMSGGTTKVAAFARIMGVSEQEFSAAFGARPLETFQRFLVEVSRLQEEGKISAEALNELGLGGIRVREVLNILGPNINLITDNVEMASDEWIKHTALQVEVQKKFATTAAQIQLLKNAVVALGIDLFFKLKPGIDGVIKSLIEFVGKIRALLDPVSLLSIKIGDATLNLKGFSDYSAKEKATKKLAKRLKTLFLVFLGLGPILTIVGIALKLLALPFAGLSKLLIRIIPLVKLLFMGMFTNPILLVSIAGIAAAIGGLYLAFKTNFLGIGDLFKDLWTSFNQFTNTGLNLKNAFKDLLSGDIDGAVKNLHLAWGSFVFWFENYAIPLISSWADKAWPELKRLAGVFVDWVADAIPNVLGALGGLLGKIGDWIFLIAVPTLGDKLKKWIPAFVDWVKDIWGGAGGEEGLLSKLGTLLENIGQWIIDVAPGIITKLWEWTKAFFEFVIGVAPQLIINLATLLAFLSGWIVASAIILHNKIVEEWLPAFVDWVDKIWPTMLLKLTLWLINIYLWIKNDAKSAITLALLEILAVTFEIGYQIGKALREGMTDGFVSELGGPLAQALDIAGNFIEGALKKEFGSPEDQFTLGDQGGVGFFDMAKAQEMIKASLKILEDAGIVSPLSIQPDPIKESLSLGGSIPGNINNSSTTNSSVFAPNISGVPMESEESMTQEIIRAWHMAQGIGNG